jgi:hypothetical protein
MTVLEVEYARTEKHCEFYFTAMELRQQAQSHLVEEILP